MEELRRIAHGIHPAILSEAGLSVALAALSEETPVALELDDQVPGRRFPGAVEAAVYQLVAEAATDAARRGASHLRVGLRATDDHLAADLSDDGPEPLVDTIHAADRVWAAGGELTAASRPDGTGGRISVKLPCA